jgi:hypothetical protein
VLAGQPSADFAENYYYPFIRHDAVLTNKYFDGLGLVFGLVWVLWVRLARILPISYFYPKRDFSIFH